MVINKDLVSMLEDARKLAGIPFTITSWTRCEEHNEKVGGSNNSEHLKGMAVDIVAISSTGRYLIISALLRAGFRRIGIAKNFIHAGIDSSKPWNCIWVY